MRFLVLVLLVACGREERKAPDVVERTRTRIEAKDVTVVEDVVPEVVEEVAPTVVAEVVVVPEVAPDTVTKEACEAACQNAAKVTLAELAPDAAPAMRSEIEVAMKERCPQQCLEKGSLESVKCIAEAKSALELAACPR